MDMYMYVYINRYKVREREKENKHSKNFAFTTAVLYGKTSPNRLKMGVLEQSFRRHYKLANLPQKCVAS